MQGQLLSRVQLANSLNITINNAENTAITTNYCHSGLSQLFPSSIAFTNSRIRSKEFTLKHNGLSSVRIEPLAAAMDACHKPQ